MLGPRNALAALLIVASCALAAGCGGASQSGDPDVPSDYQATTIEGARFEVPEGFKASAPKDVDGSVTTVVKGSGTASATLATFPGKGDAFATYPSQYKAVLTVGGGEVTGQRSVDVEGADEAYVLTGTATSADGKDVDFSSLGARKGKDIWVLTARSADEDELDPAAVTSSLRLGAG